MKKTNKLDMSDAIQSGINEFGRLWERNGKQAETPVVNASAVSKSKQKFSLRVITKWFNFIKIQ